MTRSPLLPALGIAITGGAIVGTVTSFGQGALPDELRSLANSSAPWCVAAFALGLANRAPRLGLVLGPAALLAMLLGYNAATVARGFAVSASTTLFWGLAATVVGPVFGVAATWVRSRDRRTRAAGVAPLAGILVGEGLYGLTTIAATTSGAYWLAQTVLGVALVVASGVWLRRAVPGAVTAVLSAVAALLVYGAYTSIGL